MKKIALIAAAASLAISCTTIAEGPSNKDVSSAIKAAASSVADAKKVGGEWRDSTKILGKAKKAQKAGDMTKALKLANKVKRQGQMGKAQALSEKHAGLSKDIK